MYWWHIYQSCTKIRRYKTILNNTKSLTWNKDLQLLNRSDSETLSNCFASHMACLVKLFAPGIWYMYLNATHIFLCYSFTRCRQMLLRWVIVEEGRGMCAGTEFLVFAFIIFHCNATHTEFVLSMWIHTGKFWKESILTCGRMSNWISLYVCLIL